MIRLFPYYRMTIETEMSLHEIHTRFEESTGREKFRWPWNPFPEKAFLGEVTDQGFLIHNSLRGRRDFPVEARGRFIQELKGTTVDVKIMLLSNVYVSMAMMMFLLLSSLTAYLLHMKPVGLFMAIATLSSIGFVFSYLMYTILFNLEFGNTSKLIRQTASQEGLDTKYRESIVRRTKRNSRISAVIMGIWTLAFCTFVVYDFTVNGPKAATHLKILDTEFETIPIPPKTKLLDHDLSSKTSSALVSNSFATDLKYQQVKIFYNSELLRHGWHFVKEEKIRDWDEDLGGTSVDYRKGNCTASLQWAGESANYGWDYAFSLSWGLD